MQLQLINMLLCGFLYMSIPASNYNIDCHLGWTVQMTLQGLFSEAQQSRQQQKTLVFFRYYTLSLHNAFSEVQLLSARTIYLGIYSIALIFGGYRASGLITQLNHVLIKVTLKHWPTTGKQTNKQTKNIEGDLISDLLEASDIMKIVDNKELLHLMFYDILWWEK